ncbi:MAG: UDP-2,3-diacylglucosamine diphosphatase [Halioglobus sp.]
MSGTYFISDLHLDATRPHVFEGLAAFLQRIEGCDALYILGDLFEAWVGDDDDAPLAKDTTSLFKSFTAQGHSLFLMVGNRDFLLGDAFAKSCGATLIPDPTPINLYGEPALLLHGDSLCTADTAYQAFRARARDSAWQAEILDNSLPQRREMAKSLREISHEAVSNKAEDITDADTHAAELVARQHGVSCLIHGHTHRPARHEAAFGERWVLGDWDSEGWALKATAKGLNLLNFQLIQ